MLDRRQLFLTPLLAPLAMVAAPKTTAVATTSKTEHLDHIANKNIEDLAPIQNGESLDASSLNCTSKNLQNDVRILASELAELKKQLA